jgi:hypothetical protein
MAIVTGEYVIVRTENAGVFAGILQELNLDRRVATLTDARRFWYWAGAASLSQLAQSGPSKPNECKFPIPVAEVILLEVIEVLAVSAAAQAAINAIPVWTS